MRLISLALILTACSTATPTVSEDISYEAIAARISTALQADVGEQVLIRYDPTVLPGLPPILQQTLREAGAQAITRPYGPLADFDQQLGETDVYIWLPASEQVPHDPAQTEALGQWLDAGRGRQIHFHWGLGTMGIDGVAGEHSEAYDSVYVRALDIDYEELNRQQEAAIALLSLGPVRVTTQAGTDIRFGVAERPFNKQNGDASARNMTSAVTRIDREIELPAGVVRVAPLEESVNGTIVLPQVRFGEAIVEHLRLEFEAGQITNMWASSGIEAVEEAMRASPALWHFREFCLGFNPELTTPEDGIWLPYYGYGAGVVRLSLGNNMEVGGAVGGTGTRWFFFEDATVTAGNQTLVDNGRLVSR